MRKTPGQQQQPKGGAGGPKMYPQQQQQPRNMRPNTNASGGGGKMMMGAGPAPGQQAGGGGGRRQQGVPVNQAVVQQQQQQQQQQQVPQQQKQQNTAPLTYAMAAADQPQQHRPPNMGMPKQADVGQNRQYGVSGGSGGQVPQPAPNHYSVAAAGAGNSSSGAGNTSSSPPVALVTSQQQQQSQQPHQQQVPQQVQQQQPPPQPQQQHIQAAQNSQSQYYISMKPQQGLPHPATLMTQHHPILFSAQGQPNGAGAVNSSSNTSSNNVMAVSAGGASGIPYQHYTMHHHQQQPYLTQYGTPAVSTGSATGSGGQAGQNQGGQGGAAPTPLVPGYSLPIHLDASYHGGVVAGSGGHPQMVMLPNPPPAVHPHAHGHQHPRAQPGGPPASQQYFLNHPVEGGTNHMRMMIPPTVMNQTTLMGPTIGHPMMTSQIVQTQQPVKRERKMLTIVNPDTKEDILSGVIRMRKEMAQSAQNSNAMTAEPSTSPAPKVKIEIKNPNDVKAVAPAAAQQQSSEPQTRSENATEDTPTVSVNQDQPDEFLPHLKTSTVAAAAETAPSATIEPQHEEQQQKPAPQTVDTISVAAPSTGHVTIEKTEQIELVKESPVQQTIEKTTTTTTTTVTSKVTVVTPETVLPKQQQQQIVEENNNEVRKVEPQSSDNINKKPSDQRITTVIEPKNETAVTSQTAVSDSGVSSKETTPSPPAKMERPVPMEPIDSPIAADETDKVAAAPQIIEKMDVAEENTKVSHSLPKDAKEMINSIMERGASLENDQIMETLSKGAEPMDDEELVKEMGNEKVDMKPAPVESVLDYKDDQWSPFNASGKKYYSIDQLLRLKQQPPSQKQPGDIDTICKELRKTSNPAGNEVGYSLFPHFAGGMAGINRPNPYAMKRNQSQSGSNMGDSKKNSIIQMSLSLNHEIKLNKAENAWTPSNILAKTKGKDGKSAPVDSEESLQTVELYKNFRSILNKLTPENFKKLAAEVKSLKIDSQERVDGCMKLIFEKATDEPNFSSTYAQMCRQITTTLGSAQSQSDPVKPFQDTLVNHCMAQFEEISNLTNAQQKRQERFDKIQAEINLHQDNEDKITELKAQLEEEERKLRHRSLGIVRFMGELFKQEWLPAKHMLKYVEILLRNNHEESYECLCKLLTTIGAQIDKASDLNTCMQKLTAIVTSKKKQKGISSRVRFMIQDLVELRANKWVPRRQEVKPQMIGAIQKEAEQQRADARDAALAGGRNLMPNKSSSGMMMNSSSGGGRTSSQSGNNDHRSYNKNSQRGRSGQSQGGERDRQYNDRNQGGPSSNSNQDNSNDGGQWITPKTKTFDPNKFKTKTTDYDDNTISLGRRDMFKWNQGSGNLYSTLSDLDSSSNVDSFAKGKSSDFYSKKSMEHDRYDGRGSSHKSSRENSSSRMGSDSRGITAMSSYGRNSQQGRQQNQSRPFTGSSSSSSYLSQRHDEEPNRGDRGGMMNRGHKGSGNGPVQGSRSIEQSRLKMEILDKPGSAGEVVGVPNRVPIEDNNPTDETFLDICLKENIFTNIVHQTAKGGSDFCNYDNKLKPQNLMDVTTLLGDPSQVKIATSTNLLKKQIYDLFNYGIENKREHRECCGNLLVYCLRNKFVAKSIVLSSFSHYCSIAEDYMIDVPKFWQYIPEMLGPILSESQLTLTDLVSAVEKTVILNNQMGLEFVLNLFTYFKNEKKPGVITKMWKSERLSWSRIINKWKTNDEIHSNFVVPNDLQFVSDVEALRSLEQSLGISSYSLSENDRLLDSTGRGSPSANGKEIISEDGISKHLEEMLRKEMDLKMVRSWIDTNVKTIDAHFICILSMAILSTSVEETNKLNTTLFQKRCTLLNTYLENKRKQGDEEKQLREFQLYCLYGIQRADHNLEHPQGLIHTAFTLLYDSEFIEKQIFLDWQNSKAEPIGKSVADISLKQFFSHLSSADFESSGDETREDDTN